MKVQNNYKTPSSPHVKNGFLNYHVIISARYNKCISTKKKKKKKEKRTKQTKKLIGKIKSCWTCKHPCHLKKNQKKLCPKKTFCRRILILSVIGSETFVKVRLYRGNRCISTRNRTENVKEVAIHNFFMPHVLSIHFVGHHEIIQIIFSEITGFIDMNRHRNRQKTLVVPPQQEYK